MIILQIDTHNFKIANRQEHVGEPADLGVEAHVLDHHAHLHGELRRHHHADHLRVREYVERKK